MIFLIKSTESRDSNELLREYPVLEKYGFYIKDGSAHIIINTIEELVKLKDRLHQEIIITLDTSIEIYDYWRE